MEDWIFIVWTLPRVSCRRALLIVQHTHIKITLVIVIDQKMGSLWVSLPKVFIVIFEPIDVEILIIFLTMKFLANLHDPNT